MFSVLVCVVCSLCDSWCHLGVKHGTGDQCADVWEPHCPLPLLLRTLADLCLWNTQVWLVSIFLGLSSLASEYIYKYNIYYLRNTHVWQRVCLWNAKNLANEYVSWMFMFCKWVCLGTGSAQVWQVNLSLECSSLASMSLKYSGLASEFVSGMLKFS